MTRKKYDKKQISGMKTKIYLEAGLWTVPGAIQAPYSLWLPNQVVPHHLSGKIIIPIDKQRITCRWGFILLGSLSQPSPNCSFLLTPPSFFPLSSSIPRYRTGVDGTYGWTFWEENICVWTFLKLISLNVFPIHTARTVEPFEKEIFVFFLNFFETNIF